jgi:hypothetical protein
MPIERGSWKVVSGWPTLNQQLSRLVDVFTGSDRVATLPVAATGAVSLTWPQTLVEATTTAGAVALTLPPAPTVPGYRVEVVKLGANALTVNGETITAAACFVATPTVWRRLY